MNDEFSDNNGLCSRSSPRAGENPNRAPVWANWFGRWSDSNLDRPDLLLAMVDLVAMVELMADQIELSLHGEGGAEGEGKGEGEDEDEDEGVRVRVRV